MGIGWIFDHWRTSSKKNCWKIPVANFSVVHSELNNPSKMLIARGAFPDEDGLKALYDHGIRVVLNLAGREVAKSAKEREICKRLGIRYQEMNIDDHQPPIPNQIETAARFIEECPEPIFVHCEGGRHRTGAVIATFRVRYQGWTAAEAWEEAKDHAMYSEGHPGYVEYTKGLK